jgi:pimeloyl-ACP methyl ester carboxylesterase
MNYSLIVTARAWDTIKPSLVGTCSQKLKSLHHGCVARATLLTHNAAMRKLDFLFFLLLPVIRVNAQVPDASATAAPAIRVVEVQPDVKLEVLDWGGSGRSVILLPGLGDTAHVFDSFAVKLTANYHVYGITSRGVGNSSAPPAEPSNYSAGRLGDDVAAVISILKLNRPVIAGHSVAGEVLSAVATHHPDAVSALIYIDAGYPYALYDKAHGDLVLDSIALRNELAQVHLGTLPRNPKQLDEILADVRRVEEELQQRKDDLSQISPPGPIENPYSVALLDGEERFIQIGLPVLAIFNVPHTPAFRRTMENQVHAFEVQVPQAKIIRVENADHYLFQSKEAEVLRDVNDFIKDLK